MSAFAPYKVVSALPSPLVANALYAVRVGTGFDLYLVDSSGANAFKINGGGGMLRRTDITTTGTTNLTLLSNTRRITLTGCGAGASGARSSAAGSCGGAGGSHVIDYPLYDISGGTLVVVIGVGGAAKTVDGAWNACNAGGNTTVQYGSRLITVYGAAGAASTAIANIRSRPLAGNFTGSTLAHLVDATNTDYVDATNGVIICSPYFWVGAGTRYNTSSGYSYAGGDFMGNKGGAGYGAGFIGGGGASLFSVGGSAPSGYSIAGNAGGYGAGGSGAVSANSGAGGNGRMIVTEWEY